MSDRDAVSLEKQECRALGAEFDLHMEILAQPRTNSLMQRLLASVSTARGVWIAAAVAFGLTLPATTSGLSTDDYRIACQVSGGPMAWSPFSLSSAEVGRRIQDGTLAWWTNPDVHVRFFRPLAMLSHLVEFRSWPQAPWAMHLANGLLYATLAAIAWGLYREILSRQLRVAALAALMFAVDDGHAVSVGWISGRNTLLASTFALTAFWLHVRAVTSERRWLLFASAGCTALALASAEAGLAGFGYFAAYVLTLQRGTALQRAASLAPQLIVILAWVTAYIVGDFGARGTSLYRELSSPMAVLSQGLLDLPLWLTSLLGPSGSSLVTVLPETPVRLAALLLCLPLLAGLLMAVPRTRTNAFFALGALLSLPPLFTTHPQDRLLTLASFGGFGLLSSFIDASASHARRVVRWTGRGLLGLHLVLAPVAFVVSLDQTVPMERGVRALVAAITSHTPEQVILINSPLDILGIHASSVLSEDRTRTPPEALHQLYAGASRLTVRRVDTRTLELVAHDGWGNAVMERTLTAVATMPRVGGELDVASMHVSVRSATADGRPKCVQFRFPTSLEAPQRMWLAWRGNKPVPWKPPAIGQTVTLPGLCFFTAFDFLAPPSLLSFARP